MTRSKVGYLVALVAAVAVLVGTMTATFSHGESRHGRASDGDGFKIGQGYGGMMGGRNGGGMMGDGWNDQAGPDLTSGAARSVAQSWVDRNAPGATLGNAVVMPMGYMFVATSNNQVVAYVAVVRGVAHGHLVNGATPAPSASS